MGSLCAQKMSKLLKFNIVRNTIQLKKSLLQKQNKAHYLIIALVKI